MEANKTNEQIRGLIGMAVTILIIYAGCNMCGSDTKADSPREKTRAERIEAQFGLYGQHKGLVDVIKAAANDPDSYENVATTYNDKGDYLLIKQVYTVKNSFGGRVKHTVYAKSDLDGNIFEIVGQE